MKHNSLLSIFPRDNFNQRVADFLNDQEIFILFDPVMHAADLLEGDDSSKLSDSDYNLLAAAYIHTYVSEVHIFDDESFSFISKNVITDFYKIDEDTLDQKVDWIRQELNKHEFDFMRNLAHNNSFLTELMANEVGEPWIYEAKIKAKPGLLTIIQKDINYAINKCEIEAEVLRLEQEDERIFITFACDDDELEEFLTSSNLTTIKDWSLRTIYDWTNIFTPNLHYRTSFANHFALGLEGKSFQSEEELTDYMNSMIGKKIDDVEAAHVPLLEIFDLYLMEKEESLEAIQDFMEKDSSFLDLFVAKAGWTVNGEERLDLLESAIELGKEQLTKGIYKDHGPWWYDIHTRPYMMAKLHYANELKWYEYKEEAQQIYIELLDKNPADNIGIRYLLSKSYLMDKEWKNFLKFRSRFKDESNIIFGIGDILASYFVKGRSSKTKKVIKKVIEQNPYFFADFCGFAEMDEEDYFSDDYANASEILNYYVGKSHLFARYFATCVSESDRFHNIINNGPEIDPFSNN